MIEEKSGRGALTTKSYYTTEDFDWIVRISASNQWTIIDNYTIMARYAGGSSIPQGYEYLTWDSLVFNGYSGLNYALEYSVKVYQYNTSTVLFESGWVDNNQLTYIVSRDWSPTGLNKMQSVEVYVRRNEFDDQGNRRYLVPSDMRPSGFTLKFKGYTNIEEQTLPADWFVNTTQTFQNDVTTMTTVVPDICDIDEDDFNAFIDIPNKIVAGINLCVVGIGSLLNLKYVTFVICFVLIVGLIAWLLH